MRSDNGTLLRHQIGIIATGIFVFFAGLGAARLWDEDETEYARCAREMMTRGDWIVPTINGQPWLEKPVLVYWLMIGSFKVFGPTEFAARCPSALLAIGTSLLTYHLGRRLFRPQVGLWAALVLSSSLSFVVIARAATLDSALIFCTTASLLVYVAGMPRQFWTSTRKSATGAGSRLARFRAVLPSSWWRFVTMYALLGAAVMVKGPIGVLLPIAALGLYVWMSGSSSSRIAIAPATPEEGWHKGFARRLSNVRRRLTLMAADFPAATWAMRPFTLAATVLAIAAPWYVLAAIRTHGDLWRVFIWDHNVQYILHSQQGHTGSSLYYYPLALVIGFFPWTLTLVVGLFGAVGRLRSGESNRRAELLAIVWSLTWFVVMSQVGTKLPHYIVPAFPMLAVMAGVSLSDWMAGRESPWVNRSMAAGLAILSMLGVAIAAGLPSVIEQWAPGQSGYSWLGITLASGAAVGWLLVRVGRPALSATSLVATASALFVGLLGVAGADFSVQQTSVQMTGTIERLGTRTTTVAIYRLFLPGLIYYADREQPIVKIRGPADVLNFVNAPEDYLIVTDVEGLADMRPFLSADAVVLENQTRFLKGTRLVVIGRAVASAAARQHSSDSAAERVAERAVKK